MYHFLFTLNKGSLAYYIACIRFLAIYSHPRFPGFRVGGEKHYDERVNPWFTPKHRSYDIKVNLIILDLMCWSFYVVVMGILSPLMLLNALSLLFDYTIFDAYLEPIYSCVIFIKSESESMNRSAEIVALIVWAILGFYQSIIYFSVMTEYFKNTKFLRITNHFRSRTINSRDVQ